MIRTIRSVIAWAILTSWLLMGTGAIAASAYLGCPYPLLRESMAFTVICFGLLCALILHSQFFGHSKPPTKTSTKNPGLNPVGEYLKIHGLLRKLEVKGEDDTEYASYLRSTMDEFWAKMTPSQQANAEREKDSSWKLG